MSEGKKYDVQLQATGDVWVTFNADSDEEAVNEAADFANIHDIQNVRYSVVAVELAKP